METAGRVNPSLVAPALVLTQVLAPALVRMPVLVPVRMPVLALALVQAPALVLVPVRPRLHPRGLGRNGVPFPSPQRAWRR